VTYATLTFEVVKVMVVGLIVGEHKWFSKCGRNLIHVEDGKFLGCPSISKTDKNVNSVKECVLKNSKITMSEVVVMLEILFVSSEHFERQSENVLDCCQICLTC
jgi:hypothetical protein